MWWSLPRKRKLQNTELEDKWNANKLQYLWFQKWFIFATAMVRGGNGKDRVNATETSV